MQGKGSANVPAQFQNSSVQSQDSRIESQNFSMQSQNGPIGGVGSQNGLIRSNVLGPTLSQNFRSAVKQHCTALVHYRRSSGED